MAARRSTHEPTPNVPRSGAKSAAPANALDANVGNRDPYPHEPRNLVVQVADQAGIRNAYVSNPSMDPRDFLVSQDADLNGILPVSGDAELLFRPDVPVSPAIDDELFSFVGFPVANLAEATEAFAKVSGYIREKNTVLTGTYIQGLFGSPSAPVRPWSERDVGLQDYLQPARYGGIDAMHAWANHAKGQDEVLFVLESGCWAQHLDFFTDPPPVGKCSVTIFGGLPPTLDLLHCRQHGTGTLGIVLATENTASVRKGIVGIAPKATAEVALVAPGRWQTSQQFSNMIVKVLLQYPKREGSVVLLEMCYMPVGTNAWLPIEAEPWMNSVIKAFLASTAIVIEPAGNSDLNIDELWRPPYHDTMGVPPPPLTRAIIVGASRSKDPFAKTWLSNYSNSGKVNLFSWGENVYTASVELRPGSSDPPNPMTDYVDAYTYMSGTSAAAAIIAGAALCKQSKSKKRWNNAGMLSELLTGATPCQPGAGIGAQPNLKAIIP